MRPFLTVVALLCVAGHASSQSASALDELTVPAAKLPSDCRLKPVDSKKPSVTFSDNLLHVSGALKQSFPSNPWSGTDPGMKSKVRMSIDRLEPMPDAMPDRREMASSERRFGDDVAEAYHAEYGDSAGTPVTVSAVRFIDPKLARPAPPAGLGRSRDGSTRFVLGSTVVVVSASPQTECVAAITAHLKSLK